MLETNGSDFTMVEVGLRAEVSSATIYKHFKSKEVLVATVVSREIASEGNADKLLISLALGTIRSPSLFANVDEETRTVIAEFCDRIEQLAYKTKR